MTDFEKKRREALIARIGDYANIQLKNEILELKDEITEIKNNSDVRYSCADSATEAAELDYENHQLKNEVLELKDEIAELKKQIPHKYDPEKQYTKEALLECMQAACDSMNPFIETDELSVSDDGNYFQIRITNAAGDSEFALRRFKYREQLKPPAKNRIVISRRGKVLYSNGRLTSSGSLYCDELPNCSNDQYLLTDWCDYHDRSHHSLDWKREWKTDFAEAGDQ